MFGYQHYSDGSSFITAQWMSGATEPGSSGAGLFVLNPAAGAFELRGALVGGNSSCGFQQGIDQFSRFDVTFPLVQQYLAPDASNPAKLAPVVEFFNAAKNDYLITADPSRSARSTAARRTGCARVCAFSPTRIHRSHRPARSRCAGSTCLRG